MRTLKAICNKALKDKRMPAKWYPFSDYSPPRGQGRNIALSKQDIQKLVNVKLEYRGQEDKARDFFIFSYLCNGINFKDILLLEQHNIQDNQLFYIRAKTIRTTRQDQKYIRVHLHEKARDILKKWQSQEEKMNGFIFDILPPNGTNLQKNQIIRKFVNDVNKNLKIVAKKAGISSNLTTYVARHSFASNLLKSGANKSFIQDSLGHQNLATTEAYLSGFDDSEREKWANFLL
jgi:site-specific recombinase XerD